MIKSFHGITLDWVADLARNTHPWKGNWENLDWTALAATATGYPAACAPQASHADSPGQPAGAFEGRPGRTVQRPHQ